MSAPVESWRLHPGRLWSLRMLAEYGAIFAHASATLTASLYDLFDDLNKNQTQLPADHGTLAALRADLLLLRKSCHTVDGLSRMVAPIDRALRSIESGAVTQLLLGELRALRNLFIDDLAGEQFYYVAPSSVALYSQPPLPGDPPIEPFGRKVSLKFPKCAEDIVEAGNCLALDRNTAAVFHLMRAMEGAVKRLGKRLGVKIADPKFETWYNILNAVNAAIRQMPSKTPTEITKQRRFSAASAALDNVRIASRNDVMHPKATYDRDAARGVYEQVKLFMASLADAI